MAERNYEVFKTDIDISLKNIQESIKNLKELQNGLKNSGKIFVDVNKNLNNLNSTFKTLNLRNKDLFGDKFSKYIKSASTDLEKLEAVITSTFSKLPNKAEPAVILLKKRFSELRAEIKQTESTLATFEKLDVQIGQLQKAIATPGLPTSSVDALNRKLDETKAKRQQIIDSLAEEGKTIKDVEAIYKQQLGSMKKVAEHANNINLAQVEQATNQRKITDELKETIKEQEKLLKGRQKEVESQQRIALEEQRFEQIEARRAALRSKGALGIASGTSEALTGVKQIFQQGDLRSLSGIISAGQEVSKVTQNIRRDFNDVLAGVNLFGAQGGNVFVALRRVIYGTTEPTGKLGELLDMAVKHTTSFSRATNALQAEAQRLASNLVTSNSELRQMGNSLRRLGKDEKVAETEFAGLNTQITNSVNKFKILQSAIARGATGPKFGADIRAYIDGVEDLNRQFDNLEQTLKTVYKLDPVSSKTIQRLQQMRGAVDENRRSLEEISSNLKAVDQGGSIFDKLKRGVNNLLTPFRQTKKEVAETGEKAFQLGGSFEEAAKKGNLVKASLDGAAKSATFLGDVLKTALGVALGVPLSNVIGQLTKFLTLPLTIPINTILAPFKMMSSIIGTIIDQIGQFFATLPQEFLKANKQVQDFNTTLKQMLTGFDPETIKKSLRGIDEFIRGIIAKTPFELASGQESFQRLVTGGLDPRKWLEPMADAASAMNKPMEQLIFAIQRLKAGSKGIGIDMIRDFGIPVQQVGVWLDKSTGIMIEANKVLGKSREELQAAGYEWKQWAFDAQGSLKQTPIEALDILNGYLKQNTIFAGASAARSKTLSGIISNLNDTITKLLTGLGSPIFDALTDVLDDIRNMFEQIGNAAEPFVMLIGQELGNSIKSLWENITGIQSGVDETGKRIEQATNRMKELAGTVMSVVKPALMVILALVKGEWPKAWGLLLKYAQDAIKSIGNWLKGSGREWFKWGFDLIKQIASGIATAARTLIKSAVQSVASIISSFLKPGSPPEQGPLSTIDKWGKGLVEVFTSGFKSADMDFLTPITSSIQTALGSLGLDKFKAIRQNVLEIIGGINKTGQINEELWGKLTKQIGSGNTALTEYVRLTLELKQVSKEYADAEKAGFIPKELQDKLDAAQAAVQLKEEELKLQEQINQASSSSGTTSDGSTDDPKKRMNDELTLLKKRKEIGLITEKEYLDGVASLRRQYADVFLQAGDKGAAKDQVEQAKKVDAEIFKQDREFLEKKKKIGLITEAEYLSQLADLNKSEAEKLLAQGDEAGAKALIENAKNLEKRIKEVEEQEQLKALNEQIAKERQILEIKYQKGLITEKEYREALVKLQEGYIDQLLDLGFPVDKEIEKLRSLQDELKKLTDIPVDQPQDILASFADGVGGELQKMMDDILSEFSSLGTSTWEEFTNTFHDAFDGIWEEISTAIFGEESGGLGNVRENLMKWAGGLWADLTAEGGPLSDMSDFFNRISEGFLSWSQGEGKSSFNEVGKTVGQALIDGIKAALGLDVGANVVVNEFATSIVSSTATFYRAFNTIAGSAISGFISAFTGDRFGEIGQRIANGIGKGLSDSLNPLGNETVQQLIGFFRDGIMNTDWLFILSPIVSGFRWLYDTLVGNSIVPETVDAIVSVFEYLPEKLEELDLGGKIADMFTSIKEELIEAGSGMVDSIKTGMESATEGLEQTVSDIAATVSSYWPHSPAEKGPLSVLPNWTEYLVTPLMIAIGALNPQLGSIVSLVQATATSLSTIWQNMTTNIKTQTDTMVQTVNQAHDSISQASMDTIKTIGETQKSIQEAMSHSRLSEPLGSGFGNYGKGSDGPSIAEQGGIAASWKRFFKLLKEKGTISTYGKVNASYAMGTPRIMRAHTAKLHKDEMVIPAKMAEAIRGYLANPTASIKSLKQEMALPASIVNAFKERLSSQSTDIRSSTSSQKSYLFQAGAFANAFPNVKNARDAATILEQIERMVMASEMRAQIV
jgi:chromosome segregation ATPase